MRIGRFLHGKMYFNSPNAYLHIHEILAHITSGMNGKHSHQVAIAIITTNNSSNKRMLNCTYSLKHKAKHVINYDTYPQTQQYKTKCI